MFPTWVEKDAGLHSKLADHFLEVAPEHEPSALQLEQLLAPHMRLVTAQTGLKEVLQYRVDHGEIEHRFPPMSTMQMPVTFPACYIRTPHNP